MNEHEAGTEAQSNPLLQFVEYFVAHCGPDELKERYRIMPQGLFFTVDSEPLIVAEFRRWLARRAGSQEPTEEKARKRLFGAEPLQRYYLTEGKQCLEGCIVMCAVEDPQRYRVPYYLGSPWPATDTLLPQDKVLGLVGGALTPSQEIVLTRQSSSIILSLEKLREFRVLLQRSHKAQAEFPHCTESLSEALRAFAHLVRAARPETKWYPLLPAAFAKSSRQSRSSSRSKRSSPNWSCLKGWGFYLFFDKGGKLAELYHLYSGNLGSFLQRELLPLSKRQERILGLEWPRKRRGVIGFVTLKGKRYPIENRTFTTYIEELVAHPPLHTAKEDACAVGRRLQDLVDILVRSEPIDRSKLPAPLLKRYGSGHSFFVNGLWVFPVSRDGEIVESVYRGEKLQRRP